MSSADAGFDLASFFAGVLLLAVDEGVLFCCAAAFGVGVPLCVAALAGAGFAGRLSSGVPMSSLGLAVGVEEGLLG